MCGGLFLAVLGIYVQYSTASLSSFARLHPRAFAFPFRGIANSPARVLGPSPITSNTSLVSVSD